ncbi:IclR family transcriptional regulator [Microbacterium hydrocarbonoxydans]|uniref:IclR family transcriptional regulator n=1 Tax=Microbacterium hydrocarbonoxydans TaxID=273678 RepID=UPI0013DAB9E7|nr:IclR family transcriptional regulator [Microbacterium hydrocarbonoxydans]
MPDRQPPPSALAKGLNMLEAMMTADRLSDLAKATDLSVSTAHRVLGELVATGWAYQDADKRYVPGRRMHALAGLLREDGEIGRVARPALEELRRATGMTVHFGLIKGDSVMYAAKLDGLGSYRMLSRVGGLVPLYSTSIGKAFLATLPDARVAEIVKRTGMRGVTDSTHTSLPSLLEDLQSTRQRGWAIDNGENEPGLRCVGVPVLNAAGIAIGGVSVSALEFELPVTKLREVAEHVVHAGRDISDALGHEAVDDR